MKIEKMKTYEIISYLTNKRFVHGLFYVDRECIKNEHGFKIPKKDWTKFTRFYENVFNECNEFLLSDEYYDVIDEWKKNKGKPEDITISISEVEND